MCWFLRMVFVLWFVCVRFVRWVFISVDRCFFGLILGLGGVGIVCVECLVVKCMRFWSWCLLLVVLIWMLWRIILLGSFILCNKMLWVLLFWMLFKIFLMFIVIFCCICLNVLESVIFIYVVVSLVWLLSGKWRWCMIKCELIWLCMFWGIRKWM